MVPLRRRWHAEAHGKDHSIGVVRYQIATCFLFLRPSGILSKFQKLNGIKGKKHIPAVYVMNTCGLVCF